MSKRNLGIFFCVALIILLGTSNLFAVNFIFQKVLGSTEANLNVKTTNTDTSKVFNLARFKTVVLDYQASNTDSILVRLVLLESNDQTNWVLSDSTSNITATTYGIKKFTRAYGTAYVRILLRGITGNKVGAATSVVSNIFCQE